MRKEINITFFSIIIFFFLLSSFVYAYSFPHCDTEPEAWSKVYTTPGLSGPDSSAFCLQKANDKNNTGFVGKNCSATSEFDVDNSSVCMASVCCPIEVIPTTTSTELSQATSGVVTGVNLGEEKAASELFAQSFWNTAVYPTVTGKVRTDGAVGLSYITTLDVQSSTSSVQVVAWIRGVYTNLGDNAVPLSDLGHTGSGSGGGTVTYDYNAAAGAIGTEIRSIDTQNTFYDTLKRALTDNANEIGYRDIQNGVYEALAAASENGLLGGEDGGGGISSTDMGNIMDPKKTDGSDRLFSAPSAPGNADFLLNSTDTTALKDNFVGAVSGTLSQFTESAKGTGVGSLIGTFFGNMPTSSGSAPVLTWNAGQRFGTHTIDFANYTSFLAIVYSLVILVCVFISIRNIFLKGGSG